jgi:hypothetical protein
MKMVTVLIGQDGCTFIDLIIIALIAGSYCEGKNVKSPPTKLRPTTEPACSGLELGKEQLRIVVASVTYHIIIPHEFRLTYINITSKKNTSNVYILFRNFQKNHSEYWHNFVMV